MRNNMELGWFYSPRQIAKYVPSRVTSLKPPQGKLKNPWYIIRQLDKHQWAMFGIGFCSWTWDAFDFFTVSLCIPELATTFDKLPSAISWGITLTLMLRSVGAIISGSLADRYGRKYLMVFNLTLFIVLEMATGFCNSLPQFLAVRALYGICMGGLLGPAASTALEDLPYEARGIASGLFQQGYGVGYILAAVFFRAFVPTTSHGWRSLFWFGAGPPVLLIAWRLYLPETNYYQVLKAEREARHISEEQQAGDTAVKKKPSSFRAFFHDFDQAFRQNWVLFVYMVVLMAGYNSISHGSQDLFATFLADQVGTSDTMVTVIIVVGQVGAVIGSMLVGYISTFTGKEIRATACCQRAHTNPINSACCTGRRLAMMVGCVIGAALVPAYIKPRNDVLIATTFFEQFFVGGAWGPVPIHLVELSPPALRALFYGVTYQLGNLASSASSTIEATIGQRFPLPPLNGNPRYNYGKVIGIFLGAVWVYTLLFLFVGPEMSQAEREEEAEATIEYERMRAAGVSLAEIGAGKLKIEKTEDGDIVARHISDIDMNDEEKVRVVG